MIIKDFSWLCVKLCVCGWERVFVRICIETNVINNSYAYNYNPILVINFVKIAKPSSQSEVILLVNRVIMIWMENRMADKNSCESEASKMWNQWVLHNPRMISLHFLSVLVVGLKIKSKMQMKPPLSVAW